MRCERRRALEDFVRERYGKSLQRFLREMIEERSLYDYEVAELLEIKPVTVGALRHSFGLERSNVSKRLFEEKYGPGSVKKFKALAATPGTSLADIARHFGFSRQYAWSVYEKICGTPYSVVFDKKCRALEKERERVGRERARRSKTFNDFKKLERELKIRGIPARVVRQGKAYRLVTGAATLSLRCAEKPTRIGNRKYFKIVNAGCADGDCDFCICRCKCLGRPIHYIIPRDAMPRCTITLPPQATSSRSKYGKFLEAWHLINGASRNLDGERSGRPLSALPEAGSGMRKTIYVEDLGMNERKKRKEEEVEVLGLESRGRWQGKGAGLINFQSRLRPKSPVSEEIERIIQGRLNRG